jgi:hypothetical protein
VHSDETYSAEMIRPERAFALSDVVEPPGGERIHAPFGFSLDNLAFYLQAFHSQAG